MSDHDVAVIGGGAAGLSAALVLSRAGRAVVVIDAGEPRNAPAAHMQGFLSRDGMPPGELLAAGRHEVATYGGRVVSDLATDVRLGDAGEFEVTTQSGWVFTARRVLVTTGLSDELPDVPGLRDRWGRDLLHCPYCHGYEVRDRPLGVLGGTAESVQHALLVRQWSDDLVFFTHAATLSSTEREQLLARGIGVVEGRVARVVVENDELTGVELQDGRRVAREAVFIRPGFKPNSRLLESLGCATQDGGWVVTDPTGRTSVPGLWVAGNVANPRGQVISAAGEGSAAAIAINNDLVEEDVRLAVDEYRAGLLA